MGPGPPVNAVACRRCRFDAPGHATNGHDSRSNDPARNRRPRGVDKVTARGSLRPRASSVARHRAPHGRADGAWRDNGLRPLEDDRRRRRGWNAGRRLRRRACRRRLGRRLTNGEQRKRVDVPIRLGGQANAEMDVRLGAFRIAARADRPHDLALSDGCPDRHCDRPQMDERDRVPILGADRQAAPLAGQLSREGDDSGRRRAHVGSRLRPDVDASMLAARVRVFSGDERPEHRPIDGPAPRGRARGVREDDDQRRGHHDYVARFANHASEVIEPIGCCQI